MSEEELNEELKADELKDVAGGFLSGCGKAQIKGDLKTGDLLGKKGIKGKSPSVINPGVFSELDQGF